MPNKLCAVLCNSELAVGDDHWRAVTVALTYRLGEIPLFSRRFTGVADSRHFTAVQPYVDLPDPAADFHDPPDFVFYPTYPVAFTPPPLVLSRSWIAYTPYAFRNYYVNIRRIGDFDTYLKGFSSKSRYNLQREVKKFAAADGGSLNWREFRRPDELDEFITLAHSVSSQTYQDRLLDTGLPRSPRFVARLKSLAEPTGALGYLLMLHGRAVAYVCCSRHGSIVTYDYIGYDPDAKALSPGTVLLYLVLQRLFERRDIDIFDFTEGEGEQKRYFSTDQQLCAKTYFLRPTIGNTALVNLHYRLNALGEAVGDLLDALGLKTRLRKLIRQIA